MEITKRSGYRHFESQEQIQMGLDLENSHAIMSLLRNNIYSDPLTSFVREVYSNAVDAHTRAGNKRDHIEVSILEDEKGLPNFVVRDYGDSMDKEKIKSIYAVLGKSDKTNGNNEIGGWGIGAASPLAYTDHFWIETRTNEGDKTIYRKWAQYIDTTRVGALGLLIEEESNERTGTQVTVPIKPTDKVSVVRAISMYLYFTTAKYKTFGFEEDFKPIYYNYLGNNWSMMMKGVSISSYASANGDALAVVGGIPYTISMMTISAYMYSNDIKHLTPAKTKYQKDMLKYFEKFCGDVCHYNWRIDLDIGEVDLSASREELQYTQRTNAAVLKAMYHMFIEFCEGIQIDLIQEPDFTKACFTYGNFYGGSFKRSWMHELKWSRENIGFGDKQNLIRDSNNRQNMYMLQYNLENQGYGSNTKVILRKDYDSTINLRNYKAKIWFNDTEFKPNTISKFIKFSMKREPNCMDVRWFVIDVANKIHLHNWVLDTFPQGKVSELVKYYRAHYVAPNKVTNGVTVNEDNFKSLVYYGSTYRDRADYWGPLFREGQAPRNPTVPHYYIHQDDIPNSGLDISTYSMGAVVEHLNNYLAAKKIGFDRLYYTKKVTKSYKHKNWINFFDLLRADILRYEPSKVKFYKNFIYYSIIKSDYPGFQTIRFEGLDHDKGKYAEWLLGLDKADSYIHSDATRNALYCLTDSRIRMMIYKSSSSFSNFKLEKLGWLNEYKSWAASLINSIEEYLDRYPLLRLTHDTYFKEQHGISKMAYSQYINVMEEHYGDTDVVVESEPVKKYSLEDVANYLQVGQAD